MAFSFSQNVSNGDKFNEMPKPIFWKKNKKTIVSLSPAEYAQSVVKVEALFIAMFSSSCISFV